MHCPMTVISLKVTLVQQDDFGTSLTYECGRRVARRGDHAILQVKTSNRLFMGETRNIATILP